MCGKRGRRAKEKIYHRFESIWLECVSRFLKSRQSGKMWIFPNSDKNCVLCVWAMVVVCMWFIWDYGVCSCAVCLSAAEHMINEKHIKSKSVIWFVAAGACSFLSICIKFHHWKLMFTSETQHLHRWQRCHRCYWSLITIDLCTHSNKPLCCEWFKHLLSALHGLFTVSSVWCWRAHAILRKAMNTFGIRN